MFLEGPAFSVHFVGFFEVLNLPLPVLAPSESVTMSGPARTLLILNMSRLHFLVLVLQSSNSFDHKHFSSFVWFTVYYICEFEFFDRVKSNNDFFCSTF